MTAWEGSVVGVPVTPELVEACRLVEDAGDLPIYPPWAIEALAPLRAACEALGTVNGRPVVRFADAVRCVLGPSRGAVG